jgi:hypothetical protein
MQGILPTFVEQVQLIQIQVTLHLFDAKLPFLDDYHYYKGIYSKCKKLINVLAVPSQSIHTL